MDNKFNNKKVNPLCNTNEGTKLSEKQLANKIY